MKVEVVVWTGNSGVELYTISLEYATLPPFESENSELKTKLRDQRSSLLTVLISRPNLIEKSLLVPFNARCRRGSEETAFISSEYRRCTGRNFSPLAVFTFTRRVTPSLPGKISVTLPKGQ
ncbi:hypothetical protein CEXT_534351 [Caerostris extrusa]|uniref:Uncharacterized protein n=1 Tax=Caerostris extrusa TaxID=172846 RepID=A0AAV4VE81_CAEEX|nr:hypothetical protein CEXT_534351 [Caerostris extrusa]